MTDPKRLDAADIGAAVITNGLCRLARRHLCHQRGRLSVCPNRVDRHPASRFSVPMLYDDNVHDYYNYKCDLFGPIIRFSVKSPVCNNRHNNAKARAAFASSVRAYRHSEAGEPKMVDFRDPERSLLMAGEQRKRDNPPFAGRHN
ncbi:MAG: hypothetical protein AB7E60_06265 [Sphingobium sp.]